MQLHLTKTNITYDAEDRAASTRMSQLKRAYDKSKHTLVTKY